MVAKLVDCRCADLSHRRIVLTLASVLPSPTSSSPRRSSSPPFALLCGRYAAILAKNGIELEVRASAGSLENLDRLKKDEARSASSRGRRRPRGRPDADDSPAVPGQRLLRAGLGLHPWRPAHLTRSEGRAIASPSARRVGRPPALAQQLLTANEIEPGDHLVPLSGLQGRRGTAAGADRRGFHHPPRRPRWCRCCSPGIQVMNFSQADAYAPLSLSDQTRLPTASPTWCDFPTTCLLAPTANLVVRDDLHPCSRCCSSGRARAGAWQDRLFQGRRVSRPTRTPSFHQSPGRRHHKVGFPPFLQRYLPFWLAVLIDRLIVLLVPVVALLIPLLKVAPPSTLAGAVKVFRCWQTKFLEDDLKASFRPGRLPEYRSRSMCWMTGRGQLQVSPGVHRPGPALARARQSGADPGIWRQDMKAFLVVNPRAVPAKYAGDQPGGFCQGAMKRMLGDIDRQQSSQEWLGLRPERCRPSTPGGRPRQNIARLPKGTSHVILDTPAGLRGKMLERVLVETVSGSSCRVQPSIFDMWRRVISSRDLLAERAVRRGRADVAVVGMRVDARTRAAGNWNATGLPAWNCPCWPARPPGHTRQRPPASLTPLRPAALPGPGATSTNGGAIIDWSRPEPAPPVDQFKPGIRDGGTMIKIRAGKDRSRRPRLAAGEAQLFLRRLSRSGKWAAGALRVINEDGSNRARLWHTRPPRHESSPTSGWRPAWNTAAAWAITVSSGAAKCLRMSMPGACSNIQPFGDRGNPFAKSGSSRQRMRPATRAARRRRRQFPGPGAHRLPGGARAAPPSARTPTSTSAAWAREAAGRTRRQGAWATLRGARSGPAERASASWRGRHKRHRPRLEIVAGEASCRTDLAALTGQAALPANPGDRRFASQAPVIVVNAIARGQFVAFLVSPGIMVRSPSSAQAISFPCSRTRGSVDRITVPRPRPLLPRWPGRCRLDRRSGSLYLPTAPAPNWSPP